MATRGDRFEMPDGSVYLVESPGAETSGEYVQMEFVLPGDCVAPPPHVHPHQVEEYEVIEGKLDVMVDGEWSTIGVGERASVPIGTMHTFRNGTGQQIRVRNWHRPAMQFEEFIERTCANLDAAGIKGGRDPRVPMILSAAMLRYPETLAPARRRERIPMRVMAAIGRLIRLPA
jgi:mannose-6-phosphate isomerase-like protein (cupin superfamily)